MNKINFNNITDNTTVIKLLKKREILSIYSKALINYELEKIMADDSLYITRCPECGSPDHTMITGAPYKCMDCGNVLVM